MKNRITAIAMAGALMGAFAIAPINAVVAEQTAKKQVLAARPTSNLLKEREVTGTLPDGRTLSGKLTITNFSYNRTTKQLTVSGEFAYGNQSTGTSFAPVIQQFSNIPATLTKSSSKQVGSCDVLFLDLGPIFLDVLGLQVDLSEIVLDINAVSGSGNLLGNLLCQLVGLLDGPGLLTNILQIIGQINTLLNSL